jgi:alpha-beta hydrolase superfamily lysophospholipase
MVEPQGPTVVFVHRWPLNSDMWDHHVQVLAGAGFRTVAYDRRGFGRSHQPDGAYDYDTLAADLKAIIDASAAPKVVLVGYSIGRGEIIRYLSRHGSGKVERIALVGTIVPGLVRNGQNRPGKAKLVLYSNASHGLVVTERDRVTEDLLGFLKACAAVEQISFCPVGVVAVAATVPGGGCK